MVTLSATAVATETGVTLHHMEAKPDRGDIVAQRAVPIAPEDTALTLTRKLADNGINIEYIYGTIETNSQKALIILGVTDVQAAARFLR